MNDYRHHVSGFFADRASAEIALVRLVDRGLPRERISLFAADPPAAAEATPPSSKEVLKDVLVDGAIGTVVGAGVGAVAQLALVAASVSLFVASPVIAPLMLLGWGASLGGFIGAAAGAGDRKGEFSALVGDAISSGQFVLIAETASEPETLIARDVMQNAVGHCNDVSTA